MSPQYTIQFRSHKFLFESTLIVLFSLAGCQRNPEVVSSPQYTKPANHIRVMSFNIGHGRGSAVHQLLVGKKKHIETINNIGELIKKHQIDVVAFQEIDAHSFWSGGIDQVKEIATHTQLSHYVQGSHVHMAKLTYGTAIVSRFPTLDSMSKTFSPSPPLPNKGFVLSQIQMDTLQIPIIVISLHLDFARKKVRTNQLLEISTTIETLPSYPLIIMGDYNMEWNEDMIAFCRKHSLRSFQPKEYLPTFPHTKMRLDWILISESLNFTDYRVLSERLSDHKAVIATIEVK